MEALEGGNGQTRRALGGIDPAGIPDVRLFLGQMLVLQAPAMAGF